jgi:hypothetical protein
MWVWQPEGDGHKSARTLTADSEMGWRRAQCACSQPTHAGWGAGGLRVLTCHLRPRCSEICVTCQTQQIATESVLRERERHTLCRPHMVTQQGLGLVAQVHGKGYEVRERPCWGCDQSCAACSGRGAKRVRRARVSDRGRVCQRNVLIWGKHCSGTWRVMGVVRFLPPLQRKAQQS